MLTRLLIACFCTVVWVCFLLWLDFALVVVACLLAVVAGRRVGFGVGAVWWRVLCWCVALLFDLLLGGWFRVYIVL